eukprot:3641548-Prymnesium_polylepis.1
MWTGGLFWGVWDACIKRNVKTTLGNLGAPPSLAARQALAIGHASRQSRNTRQRHPPTNDYGNGNGTSTGR